MAFMKNNVNLILLTIVILSMIGLVGITVYYQESFKNLYDEYEVKIEELNNTMSELHMHMTKLNETEFELELRSEREEQLTGKYTTIKGEKDELDKNLEETRVDLQQAKDDYIRTHNELRQTQQTLSETEESLKSANKKVSKYKELASQIDKNAEDVRATLNSYLDEGEACYSVADDIEGDFDDVESDVSSLKGVD